ADTGASGTDSATVNGTAAAETFEVNHLVANQVSSNTADNPVVNFTGMLENLTVDGDLANDVFNVAPSLTTVFSIDGDLPVWGQGGVPPGDTFNLFANGRIFDVNCNSIVFFPPGPAFQIISLFSIETLNLNDPSLISGLTTWRFDLNNTAAFNT